MRRFPWKCVALLLIYGFYCTQKHVVVALNVALHAQLFPANDKVVGSVITTNGLKLALQERPDVETVEIFYPAHYTSYMNHTWDMVLIEGWFPSIDQFLSLTRNNFPEAKIVFISLDPIYPGKEVVRNFDIDGILTNSKALVQYYNDVFPTEHMLLAADTNIMRPFHNISRDFGAVYIGAGGNMLEYKPELYHLLVSAVPYGLRLHGNAWEGVPVLKDVSKGGLPQHELARAYASAHVVLGSTIDAQSQYQMINNRIFEALACGALVVTKHAQELADLDCEALLLTNETHTFHTYMQQLKRWSPEKIEQMRQSGRELILRKHTWSHRVVQIIDFYHRIVDEPNEALIHRTHQSSGNVCGVLRCLRANCPRLLWLVSPHLAEHADYLQVARAMGKLQLCTVFSITSLPSAAVTTGDPEALMEYDYIVSFVTPFDELDTAMRALPAMGKSAAHLLAPILQKRACYLIGYDSSLVEAHLAALVGHQLHPDRSPFQRYDSVWYRSEHEVQLLASLTGTAIAASGRMQHMFALGAANKLSREASSAEADPTGSMLAVGRNATAIVILCVYPFVGHCSRTNREYFLRIYPQDNDFVTPVEEYVYTLLLLGGTWDQWLGVESDVNGLPFLSARELHSVVHVGDGRTGEAVRLLQRADVVVILNPSFGNFDSVAALQQCQYVANTGDTASVARELLLCQRQHGLSTAQEVLWPLVAAAVASARIHLLNRSPHLLSVAEDNCSGWDQEAFVTMVRTGMNRLLGLGSVLASVVPKEVRVRQTRKGSTPALQCAESCPSPDSSLLESFFANHPDIIANARDESAARVLFVRLEYAKFQVGRDGECCIQQKLPSTFTTSELFADGVQVPGDKVCLMRPYEYLIVKLRSPMEEHICKDQLSLHLSVQLRGSFFGDPFFTTEMNIDTPRSFLVPAPVTWNNEWLSKHNAYVYTVSHC